MSCLVCLGCLGVWAFRCLGAWAFVRSDASTLWCLCALIFVRLGVDMLGYLRAWTACGNLSTIFYVGRLFCELVCSCTWIPASVFLSIYLANILCRHSSGVTRPFVMPSIFVALCNPVLGHSPPSYHSASYVSINLFIYLSIFYLVFFLSIYLF